MPVTINGNGTITGISAGGLPDGCITADDLASGAGGKILQFKYKELTGGDFNTNSATATDLPGLTDSISLTSSSNNTLITLSITPYMGGTGDARYGLEILRDSTIIYHENYLLYRSGAFKATRGHHTILDTGVSDTSSHTYKAQVKRQEGSGAFEVFYLFNNSGSAKQVMTLQEIAT